MVRVELSESTRLSQTVMTRTCQCSSIESQLTLARSN